MTYVLVILFSIGGEYQEIDGYKPQRFPSMELCGAQMKHSGKHISQAMPGVSFTIACAELGA